MFNPAGLKDGFKDSSTRALQGWSSTVVLCPPGTFSHISRQQEPAEGSGSSSCSVGSVSDAQVEETRGLELQVTSALEGLKVKAGPLTVEGQLLWSRLVPAALVSHTHQSTHTLVTGSELVSSCVGRCLRGGSRGVDASWVGGGFHTQRGPAAGLQHQHLHPRA